MRDTEKLEGVAVCDSAKARVKSEDRQIWYPVLLDERRTASDTAARCVRNDVQALVQHKTAGSP
jgi:hypothetical protein